MYFIALRKGGIGELPSINDNFLFSKKLRDNGLLYK